MSFSFRQPGNGSLFGPPVIPDNQSFSFGQPSQSGSNPTQLRWTPPTISTSTSDGDSKPNAAQQTSLEDKDEIISLLLPPKSAKNEYIEQQPAKYVFKCMDGDIQIPEYGILRTEFYYQQVKAREVDENGHIYNYKQFPRSSVKYFTDALFGIMPECKDIVETLHLLNFLLFDGQANEGLCMSCKVGRVFPMVVVSKLHQVEFRRNDHREDAPHFTAMFFFIFAKLNFRFWIRF